MATELDADKLAQLNRDWEHRREVAELRRQVDRLTEEKAEIEAQRPGLQPFMIGFATALILCVVVALPVLLNMSGKLG